MLFLFIIEKHLDNDIHLFANFKLTVVQIVIMKHKSKSIQVTTSSVNALLLRDTAEDVTLHIENYHVSYALH